MNIELFITEIEKRPALYNKKLKEYSNKLKTKELWIELCQMFIDNWSDLDDINKIEKGKELQKKWKNLRTCFSRAYNEQTNTPSGSGSAKKRKYIYFDQLLFLRDSIDSRNTTNSIGKNQRNSEDGSDGSEIEEVVQTEITEIASRRSNISNRKKTPPVSYEQSLLEILKEKKDEDKEIDEDKYFLLSLLPSFKKFNEEQKFRARTEIMSVMRNVRLGTTQNQSNNSVNSPLMSPEGQQQFATPLPGYSQGFQTWDHWIQAQNSSQAQFSRQAQISPPTQDSYDTMSQCSSAMTLLD